MDDEGGHLVASHETSQSMGMSEYLDGYDAVSTLNIYYMVISSGDQRLIVFGFLWMTRSDIWSPATKLRSPWGCPSIMMAMMQYQDCLCKHVQWSSGDQILIVLGLLWMTRSDIWSPATKLRSPRGCPSIRMDMMQYQDCRCKRVHYIVISSGDQRLIVLGFLWMTRSDIRSPATKLRSPRGCPSIRMDMMQYQDCRCKRVHYIVISSGDQRLIVFGFLWMTRSDIWSPATKTLLTCWN